ncbi:MAG: LysM peptidoglycan-binding domain-containing protein [candidate division KSB1 bacterium]|nr:LysM peptidoglycan-binding domain-containing protein [candidate division KSB1 bacterium]
MRVGKLAMAVLALGVLFSMLLTANPIVAQEKKMSMEEYNAQLRQYQEREAKAKADLQKCQTDVEQLKAQIASLDEQIKTVWKEIYDLLGVTEADVQAFRQQLAELERQVDDLAALSPEELFKRRKELDAAEAKLNELKKNKIALLSEMQDRIARIEGKIAQLRAKMPKARYDEYTVVRGDYLWKIAGKPQIYGDPYQWMRIYTYNRDQIKDPNLIYPNQVLKIHRECGPGEYLVAKGDYLQKIAANPAVYNDPTKWTRIYEANKDIIGNDPNLIYPYSVFVIPRE